MLTTAIKYAKISVRIRALGYIKMYAPITPEIAPDAPRVGMASSAGVVRLSMCAKSAARPQMM